MRFACFKERWIKTTIGKNGYFYYGKSAPKWSVDKEAATPCIRYGQLYTIDKAIIGNINTFTNIDPKQLVFSKGNEVLIPRVGEEPLDFYKCTFLSIPNVAIGEMISVYNTKENPHFMSYYFRATMRKKFARLVEGGNVSNLYFNYLKSIEIHIPSKSEQIKILELLIRIDERIETQIKIIEDLKVQKNFITKTIFNKINSKQIPLFEVADVYQPQTISSKQLIQGGQYPVYGANGIIGFYHDYNHENEQICLTCRGASVGTINFSTKYSWITGNSMVINTDNNKSYVDKEYLLYHLMSFDFSKYISGSGQPQITRESLKALKVSIPLLEIQNRIKTICKSLDLHINIESQILLQYKQQKQYLLNKLFI